MTPRDRALLALGRYLTAHPEQSVGQAVCNIARVPSASGDTDPWNMTDGALADVVAAGETGDPVEAWGGWFEANKGSLRTAAEVDARRTALRPASRTPIYDPATLAALREAAGFTRDDAAMVLGLSRLDGSDLDDYETGTLTASVSMLRRLCRLYDASLAAAFLPAEAVVVGRWGRWAWEPIGGGARRIAFRSPVGHRIAATLVGSATSCMSTATPRAPKRGRSRRYEASSARAGSESG